MPDNNDVKLNGMALDNVWLDEALKPKPNIWEIQNNRRRYETLLANPVIRKNHEVDFNGEMTPYELAKWLMINAGAGREVNCYDGQVFIVWTEERHATEEELQVARDYLIKYPAPTKEDIAKQVKALQLGRGPVFIRNNEDELPRLDF